MDGGGPLKIRVAQVGPDPASPGGMPAVIGALLQSPLADRFKLEAIPTYRDSRPVRRLLLFTVSVLALTRWCARPGLRIVHVHMAARGSMYRKAFVVGVAKAMRRPAILQIHAGPGDLEEFIDRLGPLRRRILRTTLEMSDFVLSVSTSGAEVLNRLSDAEIEVVPNPPPQIARRESPIEPEANGREVSVLYLGGFADPAKGGAVLLDALPSLLAGRADVRVVLAGPGEGPGSLPERVLWDGFLAESEKNRALEEADLFVMPSLSEGMPIALLEAMAYGLPIVASRVGAVPEILTDGLDAALVDPGDAEQLAEALAHLLAAPARREALGKAAEERARRLADNDVYGQLGRIYLDAVR
ncbi:MAG TPA: glycosyltransferase family 4 protein [Solirubrobacterales bacterium]|nr:glycosyltransferase family 4 protein [Solirubrobacterales bacterium]